MSEKSCSDSDVRIVACADQAEVAMRAARDVENVIVSMQEGREGASNTIGVTPDGYARLVVTGGSTGIAVLHQLYIDSEAGNAGIDWHRVHVFFGDERWVPADHPERNDKQATEALFSNIDIPQENLHRFPAPSSDSAYGETEGSHSGNVDVAELKDAAASYADTITTYAPDGFDIHLLGMGPEGHINSLFPHTPELTSDDTVVSVTDCPKPPPTRLSLTHRALNSSTRVWFVVAGEAKAEALGHAVSGDDADMWPAAGARGQEDTAVYADAPALSQLQDPSS